MIVPNERIQSFELKEIMSGIWVSKSNGHGWLKKNRDEKNYQVFQMILDWLKKIHTHCKLFISSRIEKEGTCFNIFKIYFLLLEEYWFISW